MNKSNFIKFILPLAAIVVIIESLVLINGIEKKSDDNKVKPVGGLDVGKVETVTPKESKVDVMLTAEKNEAQAGKTFPVEVKMTGKADLALDAINLYVKFDPAKVEISDLVFNEKLPKPGFSKISTERGVIVVNYYIMDPKGFRVASGEDLDLVSFEAKAKSAGSVDFEVSTGKEMKESATMFIENATSELLPFSSNKLTVNAIK